jgi:hypothetical protein
MGAVVFTVFFANPKLIWRIVTLSERVPAQSLKKFQKTANTWVSPLS